MSRQPLCPLPPLRVSCGPLCARLSALYTSARPCRAGPGQGIRPSCSGTAGHTKVLLETLTLLPSLHPALVLTRGPASIPAALTGRGLSGTPATHPGVQPPPSPLLAMGHSPPWAPPQAPVSPAPPAYTPLSGERAAPALPVAGTRPQAPSLTPPGQASGAQGATSCRDLTGLSPSQAHKLRRADAPALLPAPPP